MYVRIYIRVEILGVEINYVDKIFFMIIFFLKGEYKIM